MPFEGLDLLWLDQPDTPSESNIADCRLQNDESGVKVAAQEPGAGLPIDDRPSAIWNAPEDMTVQDQVFAQLAPGAGSHDWRVASEEGGASALLSSLPTPHSPLPTPAEDWREDALLLLIPVGLLVLAEPDRARGRGRETIVKARK